MPKLKKFAEPFCCSYVSFCQVRPVVMAKQLYGQCVLTIPKFRAWQKGAKIAKAALERFAQATSLEFPLFNQNAVNENNNVSWPNATQLGRALGYLAGVEQAGEFIDWHKKYIQ